MVLSKHLNERGEVMKYIDSYLINDNTVRILPIIAENGSIYTCVFEKEHFAIVGKSPEAVIEESNRFYIRPPREFYLKRKWGSLVEYKGNSIHASFQFTFNKLNK